MRRTALIVLLLLAACTGGGDPQPSPSPVASEGPAESPTPSPTGSPTATGVPGGEPTPTTAEGTDEVDVYYVRDGAFGPSGPFVEPERVALEEPTVAVARAAFEALVSRPPRNPSLRSAVPPGTRVLDVHVEDGLLVVDLSREVQGGPGGSTTEIELTNQIAWTGTQFPTVDAVQVLVEGEVVDSLGGHMDHSQPIRPADDLSQSPIVFRSPRWDEEVPAGEVTIEGTANVFEATVLLTLVDADGRIVEETFTTATAGSGTRGTWSHTFDLQPGRWSVVASADDASGGEGPPPFTTQLDFTTTTA